MKPFSGLIEIKISHDDARALVAGLHLLLKNQVNHIDPNRSEDLTKPVKNTIDLIGYITSSAEESAENI